VPVRCTQPAPLAERSGPVNPRSRKYNMRKAFLTVASAVALGALTALSPALAQKAEFDSKKFFDELSARSVSMPKGFDGKKFFDDLSATSVSSGKKFDAATFFEELKSRGVKVPASFDGAKFFADIASTGSAMPPMVEIK
jgi:secreted PhoX family phosphatase